MTTLYFGCSNEYPNQQPNTTHDFNLYYQTLLFSRKENCHYLIQSSIFEHLKNVFA